MNRLFKACKVHKHHFLDICAECTMNRKPTKIKDGNMRLKKGMRFKFKGQKEIYKIDAVDARIEQTFFDYREDKRGSLITTLTKKDFDKIEFVKIGRPAQFGSPSVLVGVRLSEDQIAALTAKFGKASEGLKELTKLFMKKTVK